MANFVTLKTKSSCILLYRVKPRHQTHFNYVPFWGKTRSTTNADLSHANIWFNQLFGKHSFYINAKKRFELCWDE